MTEPSTAVNLDPSRPASPAPARRRGQGGARSMLGGMVVGGVLGYAAMSVLPEMSDAGKAALREQFGPWLPLALAALALAIAFFAIAVHELGHVAGGLAARFHFWLYVVGPLRVEREEVGGRVTVALNREPALWGGMAGCLPLDTHDLPRRLMLLVAGGPLASLALALAAGAVAARVPLSPLGTIVAVMTAGLSGLVMVATLIPMRTGGFQTDGARILKLLRGGPPAEREAATLPLLALWSAGTPPREWPRTLVDEAIGRPDGTMDESFGQLMAFYHRLDAGDADGAGRAMDRVVELSDLWPAPFVPALFAEAAYFEGVVRRNAAAAREHLARVPEKTPAVKPYDRARAEAAVALASGDAAAAREHARRALAALPRNTAFRKERLEEILAAADALDAEPRTTAETVGG